MKMIQVIWQFSGWKAQLQCAVVFGFGLTCFRKKQAILRSGEISYFSILSKVASRMTSSSMIAAFEIEVVSS